MIFHPMKKNLRTTVSGMGQVESDEIYIGVDKKGVQYVLPVQAKAGKDILSIVQIEQDMALCAEKFPSLICRPIGAQFMPNDVIALFEFENGEQGVAIASERHYKLVPPEEVTDEDLRAYKQKLS